MTGGAPLVSVVVPARDAERTLGETLESVLAQTYAPFEVLVVDDASTDRTAVVAAGFDGVRVVVGAGRGASAARNLGVRASNGELLAFVDADDTVPLTKLADQAGFLAAHPEVGCVLGRQELLVEREALPAWLERDTVFGDVGGVPLMSMVLRRSAFELVGGFDESLRIAEDRDLLVRLRARGIGIEFLDCIVLRRRIHESNLSGSRPPSHPVLRSLRAKLEAERA
jgi:glycosyltransferase involved in cell wall biosynthesis